jgi:hypothetical protein
MHAKHMLYQLNYIPNAVWLIYIPNVIYSLRELNPCSRYEKAMSLTSRRKEPFFPYTANGRARSTRVCIRKLSTFPRTGTTTTKKKK